MYWAYRSSCSRPGGRHLNLKDRNVNIMWFCVKGMRWEQFDALFESTLKSSPPPNYLLVHLGSNDLGLIPGIQLFHLIKCSFLRCKVLAPHMTIIWSDLLPRLYWHNASKIDSARKDVNRNVKQYLKSQGGLVNRHPSITHTEKRLFRYDGTHLNQLGNSVLLSGLQGGLETLLLSIWDVCVSWW